MTQPIHQHQIGMLLKWDIRCSHIINLPNQSIFTRARSLYQLNGFPVFLISNAEDFRSLLIENL